MILPSKNSCISLKQNLRKIFTYFFLQNGARANAYGIDYAIKFNGQNDIELVRFSEVIEKWPKDSIDYLENQIVFQMPPGSVHFTNDIEVNQVNAVGSPAKILGM